MEWCALDKRVALEAGVQSCSLRLLQKNLMNNNLSLARRTGMGEPA